MTDHDNAYDGLLEHHTVVDDSQWAFGTDFEDPLAGVDTTIPDGMDHEELAVYCLMLADDALIYSHRLSEWCSRAPDLEEDIALANIALDLLGQARLLLARAAAASPSCVPNLPESSPVPPEDALAFFRSASELVNTRMVEPVNGDFAVTIVRLLLFSTWRLALLERLASSRDHVLAAIGAKGVKEVTYHRDYAARWFLTLAQGTHESRSRLVAALPQVFAFYDEVFTDHPVETSAAEAGIGVAPSTVAAEVGVILDQVFSASDIQRHRVAQIGPVAGGMGRHGMHTESLSQVLAEMQSVARAHPMGLW